MCTVFLFLILLVDLRKIRIREIAIRRYYKKINRLYGDRSNNLKENECTRNNRLSKKKEKRLNTHTHTHIINIIRVV